MWGAGRISRPGVVVVLLTTALTLGLAFVSGIVLDGARAFGEASGLGAWGAFTHPEFWPSFTAVLPAAMPDYLPDLGWALGFGALGSFATLRSAFAAAETAHVPAAPAAPAPQVADRPEPRVSATP